MTAPPGVPPYFDSLIPGFHRGEGGRFVHLGHWDTPPAPDAGRAELARGQARLNRALLELAGLEDGQRVLDVGCGFGGTLEAVDRAHREMRLVGVNLDPRQIEICASLEPRAGNAFSWHTADACRLPFPEDCFDRVLCIEALFHFASRRAFFGEAARVMRPGASLVISDMFLSERVSELDAPGLAIEAAITDGYGPWPDFWGADADHRALAAAAGLTTVTVIDATAQTLPSHQFTAPSDADDRHDPGNPMLRAALTLRWLHRGGYLTYAYMRFDKPA